MRIREATESDNEQLLRIQKSSPMGTDLQLQLDSSPDFFNRSRAYENWTVLVAEEDGKIMGAAGYALQEKTIKGKTYSMAYEYGFMVDPEARRKGVASTLQEAIDERTHDVDYYHLNITEDNHASHGFFTKHGFQQVKNCSPYMLMAYKEYPADKYKIRQAREGDIPVIVELLNDTYAGYEMYTPFTNESLARYIERLPFFHLSDIVIYEDEAVRAVAGYWDYDKVMKFTMMGFNTKWKIMKLVTSVMGIFTSMPKMPDVGDQMTNCYLMLLGYRDANAAENVIGYMVNQAKSRGVGMVSLPLDKESPSIDLLSKFRHGEGTFNWYMRANKELTIPDLREKPLYVDPIDV